MRKYVRDDVMQHYAEGSGTDFRLSQYHEERKPERNLSEKRVDRTCEPGKSGEDENRMEPESSGTAPGQGREESQQQGNSISQVPKLTRHRSGRSNRRKNLTSLGKGAGVLEWVCDFKYTNCLRYGGLSPVLLIQGY